MKISVEKLEVMVISRKPVECSITVNGSPLKELEKAKYLGVYFTSDGRPDTEISARVAQAGVVMRQLRWSVLRRHEVSRKAKLSVFRAVFVPILTYGHEIWIMTERIRSRVQAAEMRFLRENEEKSEAFSRLHRLDFLADV